MTTQNMKVLIFSPDPSLGGGVVEFSAVLRDRLGSSISVDWFFTGRRPGSIGRIFRAAMPILDAVRLAYRLVRQRHDVYHLNPSFVRRSLMRDALFLTVLRLFNRKRILVFFRGWDPHYFGQIAASRLRRGLFCAIYGHASRVLVLGSRFAVDLEALGFPTEKVHTVTTTFDGDSLRRVTRKRTDEEVRILFISRLVADKGIYQTLEAFRRISGDIPRVSLVIAGDGAEADRARQWCADNGILGRVAFPGYVRGIHKSQLLVDSDIFVLPSYHGEGCPNAVLEAMGAGLPLIVTGVGGISDVVEDGVNGIIVPPHDPDAVACAMRKLVDDSAFRARISQANLQKAWANYEASVVIRRLEAHYRAVATFD